MMKDAKEVLRSTFLAAEQAIEQKKAQVRLAEAEAERERQHLELEWRRLQWQQEALSEERRAVQRLKASLEAKHAVFEVEYQVRGKRRPVTCLSETSVDQPSWWSYFSTLAAADGGWWFESCTCPSSRSRIEEVSRMGSALPLAHPEDVHFISAPPPCPSVRPKNAPCMPPIREEALDTLDLEDEFRPSTSAYSVRYASWAQKFARLNRDIMMSSVIMAARACPDMPTFDLDPKSKAVNCHHNYVNVENHFGKEVFLTRKGAVSARDGELGIIPGSMGARSYIVKGKGNPESFHSCSHGAGRTMSRAKAKKLFTVEDHVWATQGVECRKDAGVIDETPMAYKDIDDVMAAQTDLVDVVHRLKQVLCVKG